MLHKKIACSSIHDLLKNISTVYESPIYNSYQETSKKIEVIIHQFLTSNIQFQKQIKSQNLFRQIFCAISVLYLIETLCPLVGINPIYSSMSKLGLNGLLEPESPEISSRAMKYYKRSCSLNSYTWGHDLTTLTSTSCEVQISKIMGLPEFQKKCIDGITRLQKHQDPFSKEVDWAGIFLTDSGSYSKNGPTFKKNLTQIMAHIDLFKENCNPKAYLPCQALSTPPDLNHYYSPKSLLTLELLLKVLPLWLNPSGFTKVVCILSGFLRWGIYNYINTSFFVKKNLSEDIFVLSHFIKHCKKEYSSNQPYHSQKYSDSFNELIVSWPLSFLYSFLLILNLIIKNMYAKNFQKQLPSVRGEIQTQMTTFLEEVNNREIENFRLFFERSTEIKEKILSFFKNPQSSYDSIMAFIRQKHALFTTSNPHSKSPDLKFLKFLLKEENLENIKEALKSPLSYSVPWFPTLVPEPGNHRPYLMDMSEYLDYQNSTGLALSGSQQKGYFPYFFSRDIDILHLIFLFKILEIYSDTDVQIQPLPKEPQEIFTKKEA